MANFLCKFILISVYQILLKLETCNGSCHPLAYREEVKVVCTNPSGEVVDCYDSRLHTGSKASYSCEDRYIPAGRGSSKYKHTLTCKRNGFWKGFANFQSFECQVDCGVVRPQSYIYGGKETTASFWPWNVVIFELSNGLSFEFICGGTLIEIQSEGLVILTAAHCVTDDPTKLRVALGANSSNYDYVVADKNAHVFKVKASIPHERYNKASAFENDIAILQLDKPVCLNNNIVPACLSSMEQSASHQVRIDAVADVVGFGQYDSEKKLSQFLRHARIPVVSPQMCDAWRWKTRKLSSSELCAGYLRGETGACRGDSGGGLFFQYAENPETSVWKYYVQGIVSHGPPMKISGEICYSYSVFTKVENYISWINNIPFPEKDSSEESQSANGIGRCDQKEEMDPMIETTSQRGRTSNYPQTTTATTTVSMAPTPEIVETRYEAYVETVVPTGIQLEGLRVHNLYRQRHHVPLVQLNERLNREAELYADYLIQEHIFINRYQPGKNLNKNIFQLIESNQEKDEASIVKQAVEFWYSKIDDYDSYYPQPSTFTQIVWKSTTDIGVGLKSIQGQDQKRTVVVVTYSPPGNAQTPDGKYFRENVPILKG